MGRGTIRASYGILVQVLRLPEGTKIIQAWDDRDSADAPSDSVRLTVCHPDLPEVAEGTLMPSYDPKYGSVLENGEHYEPRFLGWGNGYYPRRMIERVATIESINAAFRETDAE